MQRVYAWADSGLADTRVVPSVPLVPFVPASVGETVTHRFDAQGDVVRGVAEHAAVIGRWFALSGYGPRGNKNTRR